MQRLFDHDVAAPARPQPLPRRVRALDEEQLLASGSPRAIWSMLLDRGADPLALAALLRQGLPPSERRRAYLELVRDLGASLASRLWDQAFVGLVGNAGVANIDT